MKRAIDFLTISWLVWRMMDEIRIHFEDKRHRALHYVGPGGLKPP